MGLLSCYQTFYLHISAFSLLWWGFILVLFDSTFLVSSRGTSHPHPTQGTDVTYFLRWHSPCAYAPTNWQRPFQQRSAAATQTSGFLRLHNLPRSKYILIIYLIYFAACIALSLFPTSAVITQLQPNNLKYPELFESNQKFISKTLQRHRNTAVWEGVGMAMHMCNVACKPQKPEWKIKFWVFFFKNKQQN